MCGVSGESFDPVGSDNGTDSTVLSWEDVVKEVSRYFDAPVRPSLAI